MNSIKYYTIIIYAFIFFDCNAQTWPKYFGESNRKDESYDIIEAYDKGYYILGLFYSQDNAPKSTWLIKTDVNGEILWEKIFANEGINKSYAMEACRDGGLLICGLIQNQGDESVHPFVIKLNACGETEWCSVFTENPTDNIPWATDVKETSSGDVIVLVNEYGYHPINTMHLFKLNANGEVLWRNPYASAYNHPGSINPHGNKLLITSTNEYMIAGDVYWKDPWNPGGSFALRPLFVLIDSMGIEKWVLPFGVHDTIHGQAYNVTELTNSHFIGIASKWPAAPEIMPLFIEFDIAGNTLDYQTMDVKTIDSTFSEGCFEYITQRDSLYYLCGNFEIFSTLNGPIVSVSLDSNLFIKEPNILNQNIHDFQYWPYSFNKTLNEKYLNTSKYVINIEADISLSKLNQNLEYDTLDPGTYTYDSLCTNSGLPQSGFISLDDCDLFVDIDEIPSAKQYQESIRWIPINAYPNPVKDGKLILEFENTRHHQNMELRCYDDFGRQVHSQTIYKGQQDTDVDVSLWSAGIYVAVMYSNGGARGKIKFLIAK